MLASTISIMCVLKWKISTKPQQANRTNFTLRTCLRAEDNGKWDKPFRALLMVDYVRQS